MYIIIKRHITKYVWISQNTHINYNLEKKTERKQHIIFPAATDISATIKSHYLMAPKLHVTSSILPSHYIFTFKNSLKNFNINMNDVLTAYRAYIMLFKYTINQCYY